MRSKKVISLFKKEYESETKRSRLVVKHIIGIFFRILQLIAHALLSIINFTPGKQAPRIENVILLDSASTLAFKIRQQKLTSREVVQSYIDRIKKVNPILNCVVADRFDAALKDADLVDEFIRTSGKSPDEILQETPFLGVPFTVKDAIAIEGLKLTAGLYCRKNIEPSKEDADVVKNLKKAGGIPLAVTNVSELCMWWESVNTVYGRTRNPYNTNHIVGGSSGGEGCLQGAAGSPIGVGSDIGGSVRIPAFFNGVFGHKPSTGIGSLKGHHPMPDYDFQRSYLTSGPLTRFASDLKPLLKAMAPDHVNLLKLDEKVDVKDLKYFYMDSDGGNPLISPVEPEIRASIRHIIHYLKRVHNINASRVNITNLHSSMEIWFAKMAAPGDSQLPCALSDNHGKVNVMVEFMKLAVGLSKHTFPLLCMTLVEELKAPFGSAPHLNLINKCELLKAEFEELLGNDGVFIYPTHPTAAPLHNEPICKPFNVAYTVIFNVLGLPSTHVPMGLNAQGLPIGVQVVAARNMDRLTIAVAEELEKAFGGWVQPS